MYNKKNNYIIEFLLLKNYNWASGPKLLCATIFPYLHKQVVGLALQVPILAVLLTFVTFTDGTSNK